MPLLGEKERQQVQEMFSESLAAPVRLVMFTQSVECEFCAETRELVEEVAILSDLVQAEIYDFVEDASLVETLAIDKIPAIAVLGETDYGVRFYGIPSGYEFTTLIESIIHVSVADSGLSDDTREAVAQIADPVHLQVFITPT